jgi:hypothetical protein
MTKQSFIDRMAALGLSFPAEEIPAFESFVADLERAAVFLREVDRGFEEEMANNFRPAAPDRPTTPTSE